MKREYVRFSFLFVALVVFFAGPHFVESADAEEIKDTIELVKKAKMNKELKATVVSQLERDYKFAKENAHSVSVAMIQMPAVYWLSLLILLLGLGGPLVMKYLETKARNES